MNKGSQERQLFPEKTAGKSTNVAGETDKQVFSLYAISKGLRDAINGKFGGRLMWIRAEIAEINFHRSGHAYLELADNENGQLRAQARAMIWASDLEKIKGSLGKEFDNILKKGSQLQCLVRVEYHLLYGLRIGIQEVDATFNLGLIEKRKQQTILQLKKGGLLEKNASLPLPAVVQRIGLVGSPETSGYRDFVKQLLENEYGYRFRLDTYPTRVQGEDAAQEIVAALKTAIAGDCQAIVLIRGGGSKLDLEVFNDLVLSTAIANSPLPVFTGIGHETDRSVSDMVAHTSLKTPTAVAAFLLEIALGFESRQIDRFQKICRLGERKLEWERTRLEKNAHRFRHASTENIQERSTHMERLAGRISRNVRLHLERENSRHAIVLNKMLEKTRHLLLREKPTELQTAATRISQFSADLIRQGKQTLTVETDRLRLLSKAALKQQQHKLAHYKLSIKLVHPDQVLQLGYGITRVDGEILTPSSKVEAGAELETEFINRKIISIVKEIKNK